MLTSTSYTSQSASWLFHGTDSALIKSYLELARPEIGDRLLDLLGRVHHERAVARHALVQRLAGDDQQARGLVAAGQLQAQYEFEPDKETILARLLPQNLAIQIYRAQLESSAGFFAAQMTAMDNATRNAGDMINRLTLNYNRTRQANITKELIEIISGAEAL